MTDEPMNNGDDGSAVPPEVTVPPWLRTGPTPEQSMAGGAEPRRQESPAEDARVDSGVPEPRREVPPNRITLGTRRRDDQSSSGPAGPAPAQPPVAAEEIGAGAERGPVDRSPAGPGEADPLSRLRLGASSSNQRVSEGEPAAPTAEQDRRPLRIALLAAAGVAVLGGSAVLGYVVTRGAASPEVQKPAGCVERADPGRVSGAGPGSLDTPAATVLAFDHAYYAQRSAEKAFEAVSPSSRMTEEQLRVDGVDRVEEGTGHCVQISELSPTLLEVELTEYPPDADPVLIRQRVRVAENPDGTWGIVSITPAG